MDLPNVKCVGQSQFFVLLEGDQQYSNCHPANKYIYIYIYIYLYMHIRIYIITYVYICIYIIYNLLKEML